MVADAIGSRRMVQQQRNSWIVSSCSHCCSSTGDIRWHTRVLSLVDLSSCQQFWNIIHCVNLCQRLSWNCVCSSIASHTVSVYTLELWDWTITSLCPQPYVWVNIIWPFVWPVSCYVLRVHLWELRPAIGGHAHRSGFLRAWSLSERRV